jgi:hypothetical protein
VQPELFDVRPLEFGVQIVLFAMQDAEFGVQAHLFNMQIGEFNEKLAKNLVFSHFTLKMANGATVE